LKPILVVHVPQQSLQTLFLQVLDVIGEEVPCEQYDKWIVYGPDGNSFQCCANADKYRELISTQTSIDKVKTHGMNIVEFLNIN
jgi:hypothetical protein